MDDVRYAAMAKRIAALEARIVVLESAAIAPGGARSQDLLKRHPMMMNKTSAANALGVTRTTVYAMIKDGRLEENGMGKIPTDCVIRLIERSAPIRKRRTATRR